MQKYTHTKLQRIWTNYEQIYKTKMKMQIMKVAVMALFFTSCPVQSNYEKAIADFVQTDRSGTWTDLKFKVIEMGEPTDITVGDSIKILTDKFESDKEKYLNNLKSSIARSTASRDKESFSSMKEFYQKQIDKNQTLLDSISKTAVVLPEAYVNVPESKVLAKEIECRFSIVPPMYNNGARQEMTEKFMLNAAGDKCYRMTHSKTKK